MSVRRILAAVVGLVLLHLLGCGNLFTKDSNSGDNVESPIVTPYQDSVNYGSFKLELKPGIELDSDLKAIFDAVNLRQNVSRRAISDAYLKKHLEAFNQASTSELSKKDLNQRIEDVASSISSEDPHVAKVQYEAKLAQMLGEDPKLNGSAITIPHIFVDAAMQYYSGTALHIVLMRRLGAYYLKNPVVIFESGRMAPGYMIPDGGSFDLVAIETALLGKAKVKYGPADLNEKTRLVVDAEKFILVDLFKDDLANLAELVEEILKTTADRYHLSVSQSLVKRIGEDKQAAGNINATPFSFGIADSADYSKKRVTLDDTTIENRDVTVADLAANGYCKKGGTWKEIEGKGCMRPERAIPNSKEREPALIFSAPFPLDPLSKSKFGASYTLLHDSRTYHEYCYQMAPENTWEIYDIDEHDTDKFMDDGINHDKETLANLTGLDKNSYYPRGLTVRSFHEDTERNDELEPYKVDFSVKKLVGICVYEMPLSSGNKK